MKYIKIAYVIAVVNTNLLVLKLDINTIVILLLRDFHSNPKVACLIILHASENKDMIRILVVLD
jgi:hypothetical protein